MQEARREIETRNKKIEKRETELEKAGRGDQEIPEQGARGPSMWCELHGVSYVVQSMWSDLCAVSYVV